MNNKRNSISAKPEQHAVAVPRSDVDMELAVAKAKETLWQFIDRIKQPSKTQEYQAIKVKRLQGEIEHYVWLDVTSVNGEVFECDRAEDVLASNESGAGGSVYVTSKDIYDWMIVEGGLLVGGYSIRVMRSKMDPDQQAKLDKQLWYKLD
jgi:uncharacterized protein YegJ (DUF2314 family)